MKLYSDRQRQMLEVNVRHQHMTVDEIVSHPDFIEAGNDGPSTVRPSYAPQQALTPQHQQQPPQVTRTMQMYSNEQIQMLNRGVANGQSLDAIKNHPDFRAAGLQYQKDKQNAYKTWPAENYLYENDGPFRSKEEQQRAMDFMVTDDRGKPCRLYDLSPAYRTAYQFKAEKSSNEIMGVCVPPSPLTPEALIRAAEEDLYHTTRQNLFDKAGSKDPMVAAEARLQILQLATDPQWQGVRDKFERTEAETKPYETWLKQQPGGVQIQTFPMGTEAEMAAECARRNAEAYTTKAEGRGDGGVRGEPNTTLK